MDNDEIMDDDLVLVEHKDTTNSSVPPGSVSASQVQSTGDGHSKGQRQSSRDVTGGGTHTSVSANAIPQPSGFGAFGHPYVPPFLMPYAGYGFYYNSPLNYPDGFDSGTELIHPHLNTLIASSEEIFVPDQPPNQRRFQTVILNETEGHRSRQSSNSSNETTNVATQASWECECTLAGESTLEQSSLSQRQGDKRGQNQHQGLSVSSAALGEPSNEMDVDFQTAMATDVDLYGPCHWEIVIPGTGTVGKTSEPAAVSTSVSLQPKNTTNVLKKKKPATSNQLNPEKIPLTSKATVEATASLHKPSPSDTVSVHKVNENVASRDTCRNHREWEDANPFLKRVSEEMIREVLKHVAHNFANPAELKQNFLTSKHGLAGSGTSRKKFKATSSHKYKSKRPGLRSYTPNTDVVKIEEVQSTSSENNSSD